VQACKAPSHSQVHSKGSPELENDSLHGYDSWHIGACSPSSSSALGAVHTAMSQDLAVARSEAERLQLELHTVESRFEDKLRSLRKQVRIYIVDEKCARCAPQSWCLIFFRTAASANQSVIMHEWLLCVFCIFCILKWRWPCSCKACRCTVSFVEAKIHAGLCLLRRAGHYQGSTSLIVD
jgi:hypothetical protein